MEMIERKKSWRIFGFDRKHNRCLSFYSMNFNSVLLSIHVSEHKVCKTHEMKEKESKTKRNDNMNGLMREILR